MDARHMAISEFKARCLEVLKQVKRTGQPVLITRRGEPIAEITRPRPKPTSESWLGRYANTGELLSDVVEPAMDASAWGALSAKKDAP
jgi:antitoxin (DNA-binding transcriptional repressor) of toxin-antitoxin stability system